MSTAPKSATPSKETNIPDLTDMEKEKLENQYKCQLKYYENEKPWKYYLRKVLWKFAKSVNFKYDKNMLMRHITIQLNNDTLNFENKDETFNPKEIKREIDKFIQYYVPVLKDYEQYFGETENVPEFDKSVFTKQTYFNIHLKNKLKKSFVSTVRWNEFITMWYQEIDKNKVVPLFFLHQKRYYDWLGNKVLQTSIEAAKDKLFEK